MRRFGVICVLFVVTACGPKSEGPTTPPGGGGGTPVDGAAGMTKLDFDKTVLQGIVYIPEALSSVPMPVREPVKRKIADQQKRFDKAKGAARVVEGEHLARLLWASKQAEGEPDQRARATAVLREIAPVGKAEERLEHMLAVAAQATGEGEFALSVWQDLATRFPDSDDAGRYQAMVEVAKLRAGAPATRVDDTRWEAAYANAWIAFYAGNDTVAVAALTTAATAWPHVETLPALRRDIMLIFARAGVPAGDAMKLLQELDKKDGGVALPVLYGLAQAYYFAGRDGEALTVLVVVAGLADAAILPEVLRLQAQAAFNMDDAGEATTAAQAAWAAVTAGGAAVPPERAAAVADTILHIGAHYTYAYALSEDRALGEAAYKLLGLYGGIPGRADTARVKEMHTELGKILGGTSKVNKNAAVAKQVVRGEVAKHYGGVVACYERQLATERDLAGTLVLMFKITAAGKINGISGNPDVAGLHPVGACVAALAHGWSVPVAGETEVSFPISFKVAAP